MNKTVNRKKTINSKPFIAKNNNLISNINGFIENTNRIREVLGNGIELTEKNILNDTHVSSCVQSRISAVRNYEWEIKCDDEELNDFITKTLTNLGMYKLIEYLMDAIFYGYSITELRWRDVAGKRIPTNIKLLPNDWFRFNENGLCYFINENGEKELIDYKRCIITQYKNTKENPYGQSVYKKCVIPVMIKEVVTTLLLKYTEISVIPQYIGKLQNTASEEDFERLKDVLVSLISGTSAVLKDDENIEVLNSITNQNNDLLFRTLNYANNEISKAILSNTLTTENTGSTGSYAMSKTHHEVMKYVTFGDIQLIKSKIDELIKWVVTENYLSYQIKDLPEIIFYEKEDVDKELVDVIQKLSSIPKDSKITFTPEFFIEQLGFKRHWFKIADFDNEEQVSYSENYNENKECVKGGKLCSCENKCKEYTEKYGHKEYDDQNLIDKYIEYMIENNDDLLDELNDKFLNEIKDTKNYKEVLDKIPDCLDFNTDKIEDVLNKSKIVSSAIGEVSIKDEINTKRNKYENK